jgi:hypothetical protein
MTDVDANYIARTYGTDALRRTIDSNMSTQLIHTPFGRFGRGAVERNSSAFQGGQRKSHGFGLERRQIARGLRRLGRREGRSAGRLRASSQGVEGGNPTPRRGERGPPFKN